MKKLINAASIELTDIWQAHCQHPAITLADEETYICWQQYEDRQDRIYAGKLVDGKIENPSLVSGQGQALRPAAYYFNHAVWFVWSECIDRGWSILGRYLRDGVYSDIIHIDSSEAAFYPYLSDDGENLMVLWSEQGKGYSRTAMKCLDFDQVSEKEILSQAEKSYRPSGKLGGDGRFYLAYDVFNGEDYDVVVRARDEDQWTDEVTISKSKDWATRTDMVPTQDGVTVGWYEIGERAAFAYLSADIRLEDGQVIAQEPDKFTSAVNWYQTVSMASNNNGVSVFAYNWGKYNIHVRYRRGQEAWSDPVVMSYDDGHCAVHPKVAIDNKDRVHLLWQFSNKNGHMDRNSSIIYNTLTLEEMDKYGDLNSELIVDQFVQPIEAEKKIEKNSPDEVRAWLDKNGYEDLMLAFGDIHGQSSVSDGVGEIDQYFHFARAKADLDFTALTDHDCYPDWISESEWEWIRTCNRLANTDGELATLLAYEWTPNEYRYDYGHKNVYYRGDDGGMFRSGDVEGMTPFRLFESLKAYDAIAIPHHPAADWKLVSAATDWDFHDPEVQRLVEIFSRHAPFEYYGNTSKYTKNIDQLERCSVQDALAKGHRLGVTAGSDSHQLEHGIEGGLVAVFIPELTRENVFDAMYDRFVYGTTGSHILVSFRINGKEMGQELALEKDKPAEISVSILGTDKLKVELLKNNQLIKTLEADSKACDFTYKDEERNETDYYYIRVTQEDDHMAWSSPIWVDAI